MITRLNSSFYVIFKKKISNDFSKLENSQVLFEKFIENIMKFTFISEKKNCNIPFFMAHKIKTPIVLTLDIVFLISTYIFAPALMHRRIAKRNI